jgi:outer membrane biosynthesis protein TonB
MVTVRRVFLAGVIVAFAAGGCATAGAKAQPEPAALEVPAPPPRVIVPPDPEPAQPPAPMPEPEARQQKSPRRPTSPRPDTKADPARGEKKVEGPPPVAETVNPTPPATPPTATLQQALPATQAEVERQVRDQLARAQSDLRRVDYLALNADARSQYDTAKRFIEQAEQALKEKNLVFAAKVAEKAAGLAASLVGRMRPAVNP